MNETKPTPQIGFNQSVLTEEQKLTLGTLTQKMFALGVSVKPLPLISVGPLVSIYRFVPDGSTRVSQIENLSEDFSIILGKEVMVKRFPGETAVSVTVPNDKRTDVLWLPIATEVWKYFQVKNKVDADLLGQKIEGGRQDHTPIPLGFGVDSLGRPFIEDLTSCPHLLIGGTTGSGKSTLIRSIIASIVYTMNSSTINLVLNDTKGTEYIGFAGLPHLLFPISTTVMGGFEQMDFLIEETNRRFKLYPRFQATNIHEYNAACGEQDRLALIVMFIDECADLADMKKVFEEKMGKIVQKSRAAGIHVVASTQRPTAKMIDGTIKSNMQARLSFRFNSQIDSRVVLDCTGAEHLMMQGDMLYKSARGLVRLHSPMAKPADIKSAVEMAIHNG